jgi:hypothetical protein
VDKSNLSFYASYHDIVSLSGGGVEARQSKARLAMHDHEWDHENLKQHKVQPLVRNMSLYVRWLLLWLCLANANAPGRLFASGMLLPRVKLRVPQRMYRWHGNCNTHPSQAGIVSAIERDPSKAVLSHMPGPLCELPSNTTTERENGSDRFDIDGFFGNVGMLGLSLYTGSSAVGYWATLPTFLAFLGESTVLVTFVQALLSLLVAGVSVGLLALGWRAIKIFGDLYSIQMPTDWIDYLYQQGMVILMVSFARHYLAGFLVDLVSMDTMASIVDSINLQAAFELGIVLGLFTYLGIRLSNEDWSTLVPVRYYEPDTVRRMVVTMALFLGMCSINYRYPMLLWQSTPDGGDMPEDWLASLSDLGRVLLWQSSMVIVLTNISRIFVSVMRARTSQIVLTTRVDPMKVMKTRKEDKKRTNSGNGMIEDEQKGPAEGAEEIRTKVYRVRRRRRPKFRMGDATDGEGPLP